ncbi:MAG: cation diffusion facilitator family transporter [Oscillospiraceae bacterium]|nr:cation diffusion facilitator family transporter [Oscillospiraceae bacterium]
MNNAVIDFFIKDINPKNSECRKKGGALSSSVGIVCNILLSISKFIIGSVSGSIAITADAFNNLFDLGSCLVSLFGMRMAAKPADKDHPFGHGRYEYVATLAVAVTILLVAFELGKSSVLKIIDPQPVRFSLPLAAVMLISVLVKLWMYFFNRRLGTRLESSLIKATAADSIGDCISTGAVLLATAAGELFHISVDGYAGLLVACFIMYSGVSIIRENLNCILGENPSAELSKALSARVSGYEGVLGVHDLIIHNYGPTMYIATIHAEVSASEDILVSHDLIDKIEKDVVEEMGIMLTIHMDPVVTDSEYISSVKHIVRDIVSGVDSRITMHDFRMVDGPTHTNLIFDVVVPFGKDLTAQGVKEKVMRAINEYNEKWFAVITVDRAFHD